MLAIVELDISSPSYFLLVVSLQTEFESLASKAWTRWLKTISRCFKKRTRARKARHEGE